MIGLLRRRVVVFCSLLAALLLLIAWTGVTAWRDLGSLRRRFTAAEFESFRIAGQLQSSILELNSALLAYDEARDELKWQQFESRSGELNEWISRQRDVLKTAAEKQVLAEVDQEYDRYLSVAQSIREKQSSEGRAGESALRQLNTESDRIFALARRLADAHRRALGDLLGASQRSLHRLEILLCLALVGILGSCVWGARVILRDSIMPLRRQVVEARALAEQHEKMASLGVLAAGVAHEIRNPLTAMKIRVFTLNRRLESETPAREDTAVIESEILRLERIMNDFLLFARPGEPELEVVNAGNLCRETVALLSPELAASEIELRMEGDTDGLSFRGDPRQLKQVLINLIRNGAESIKHGGTVILRIADDYRMLAGRQQRVVLLEVLDTGSGVPPEVQQRLFDPFFTTKETGTGLGLSIAMRILEKHGGTLQFQTVPGRGSTFGIVLPGLEPSPQPCSYVALRP